MDTVKGRRSNLQPWEPGVCQKQGIWGADQGWREKTQGLNWPDICSGDPVWSPLRRPESWRREAGTWPLEGPPCSLQGFGAWDLRVALREDCSDVPGWLASSTYSYQHFWFTARTQDNPGHPKSCEEYSHSLGAHCVCQATYQEILLICVF